MAKETTEPVVTGKPPEAVEQTSEEEVANEPTTTAEESEPVKTPDMKTAANLTISEVPEKTTDQEALPPVTEEQQAKKAFLQRFRRKSSIRKQEETTDTANTTPISNNVLAQKIYKDIAETKGSEFIVIRIKKSVVLLVLGIILVLLWLIPVLRWVGVAGIFQTQSPAATPRLTPAPVELDSRINNPEMVILVRNNADQEQARRLQEYLLGRGYLTVTMVDDPGGDYTGVKVVVRPGDSALRTEMEEILGDTYEVSSPSAELTEDSTVDAVILVGL